MKIGEYEQMMSYLTRPDTRTKLAGGTNPKTGQGFQKGNKYGKDLKGKPSLNIEGKNQFPQLTKEEMQAIIDANPELETPRNFEDAKLLGRRAMENNPDLVFKRRGPPKADPKNQKARDIKRGQAQINLEGRKLKLKSAKDYQVHHIMPLAGGEDLRTGDYAIVSKKMNAKMSKYNKKINKLVNEAYDLDYSKTENLKKLKNINQELFSILKETKKDLPKKYKGLLGFNKLTPVLDTFDDKGRQVLFAEPQGIDYKKSIAGVRGDKVKDTKTSVMQNMAYNAPTFSSNPMADPSMLKKYGKYALQVAGTPLGAGVLTAGFGVDPTSAIDRSALAAEAAFAPALVKGAKQVATTPGMQRILNLGLSPKMAMRAARVASPIGIATLAGEGIYQGGKYMLERKKLLESLTDEQRDDLLSRERSEAIQQNRRGDPEAFSGIMAANGGLISREGFADGPDDPSKRKFMKIAGGIASIPILGKFLKPAVKVAPVVAETVRRSAEGIPAFISDLIAKVKLKAEATGMKYFTGKSSDEFADVYQADNYVVTEQGNKTIIREVDQDGDMLYKENQIEIDVDPETGGVTYREASARPDGEGKLKDVEEYIEDDDLENMRKYTYDE